MAKVANYVELHARSAFSFLRGAALPEEYAARCSAQQQHAMALLDLDGVYGAPRFHMAAQKSGIVAHVGAEVTCTDGGRYPLLVRNRQGYQNLCRLISLTKLRVGKNEPSAATPEEIAEYAGGLICLTGDENGPLAIALSKGDGAPALDRMLNIFGRENVYAEIQRHLLRDEEARNQAVIELARRMRVPLVATNGPCHATPEQRELLDVFTCLRHKVTLAEAGRLLARNAERHVKSPGEMATTVLRSAGGHRQHARASRRAWNSRWPIWATNFRDIRCRRARRMNSFCASAPMKARAAATAVSRARPRARSSANWR